MQYVMRLTHERINLGAGTLYGTLSKLEKASLVAITREDKRKYYKITALGGEVLEEELQMKQGADFDRLLFAWTQNFTGICAKDRNKKAVR